MDLDFYSRRGRLEMRRAGLKELAAAMRSHPRLREASRRFFHDFVGWRERLGLLNKITCNLARERIFEHLLYLHFARAGEGGDKGATFARLAALSASRDQIGGRAVRTALRLAEIAGLVSQTRSPSDGRLRIYRPSEAMLAQTREYFSIAFRVVDALKPSLRVSERLYEEPNLMISIFVKIGQAYLEDEVQPNPAPDALTSLLQLDGGRAVLATVIDCHWRGRDLPASQDIAKRFYVSPSQTRAILRYAEVQGLIAMAGRGRIADAEPLTSAYLDALCRFLAFVLGYGLDLDVGAFQSE